MPPTRFEPSVIKNKIKREEIARKNKKSKRQSKLQTRLERAKLEKNDPAIKKKRLAENVPRTLDNAREFDPSMLTANPEPTASSSSSDPQSQSQLEAQVEAHTLAVQESFQDIENDPFATYFNSTSDPSVPPRVLITTSPKASKLTYEFCDELVDVIPGAEFIRRKKGKGFELGRIASWAGARGYSNMIVVNEDMKKPNAITFIYLPEGPTAYFRLSSVQLTKEISGHARSTTHYPELILNNFVTRLGHAVGRMFQTLFPQMPEFQGRQVVTLHNQRDFLFFRRHRYAFRSTDKAALQEIGPRFTLKLRWMKEGIPAVAKFGQPALPLEFAQEDEGLEKKADAAEGSPNIEDDDLPSIEPVRKVVEPPTHDEYIWEWKPQLEATRRTFFL